MAGVQRDKYNWGSCDPQTPTQGKTMKNICKNCKYSAELSETQLFCQYSPPTAFMIPMKMREIIEKVPSKSITGVLTDQKTYHMENQILSTFPPVKPTYTCSKFESKHNV